MNDPNVAQIHSWYYIILYDSLDIPHSPSPHHVILALVFIYVFISKGFIVIITSLPVATISIFFS